MTSAATPYSFMAINLTAASISAGLSEIFPGNALPQISHRQEKPLYRNRPTSPDQTDLGKDTETAADTFRHGKLFPSFPFGQFMELTGISVSDCNKESSQKSDNSRLNTWKAAIGSTVVPDLEIIRSSTLNLRLQRPVPFEAGGRDP